MGSPVPLPTDDIRPSGGWSAGRWILLVVLGAGVGLFFFFGLAQYLSLESLKTHRDEFLAYTLRHYGVAVGFFIAIYILQTAFSLPGGAILTLAAGFLFGAVSGTVIVNVGATAGATLAFLVARYLLRDWIESRFGERLASLQAGFSSNAFHYLLTLRLIPLFPFFLVNLVSGVTRIGLGSYIAATAIGIIPGSFVYAYAGRQLGTINSVAEIASPSVLLAFTLLGALALIPVIYRKYISGKNR